MVERERGGSAVRVIRLWWAVALGATAGCGGGGGGTTATTLLDGGAGDATGDGGGATAPDAVDAPNVTVRPDPAFPIFDDSRLHDVELTMAPEDWQSILDDSRGDDARHATFTYDGVVVPDVAVRPSGESSRFPGNTKMSMRISFSSFPEHGRFGGLEELKLKGQWDDGSMMRDRLSSFVYRAAGFAPREAHARVVVNGELRGVYAVVQLWNRQSITEQFAEPVGPLYRIRASVGDPYDYLGDAGSLYVPHPWEPHIDHPSVGDEVIGPFLGALAAGPARLDAVADLDSLLGYLAAGTLVMNTDGMVGDSGVEDHFQYFDPATGKFFTLPWDCDNTFGSHNEKPDRSIFSHFSHSVLTMLIRDSGDLAKRYRARVRDIITAAPAEAVQAEADRIYQQIRDAVHADPIKRTTNGAFDWSLGYIKDFISQRYAVVRAQVGM